MRFQHYVERVEKSDAFRDFQNKNPDAYLCAGFFVMDFETGHNQHHIDYFIPKSKKIATFLLDDKIQMKLGDSLKKPDTGKVTKIAADSHIDLDMMKGIVEDEMKNHTVTGDIKKIIAVYLMMDNKRVWSLNSILSNLNIVNMHLDDASDSILKFEKVSMMDIIKAVPSSSLQLPPQPEASAKKAEKTEKKEKKEKQKTK